jgi:hypothetical protein
MHGEVCRNSRLGYAERQGAVHGRCKVRFGQGVLIADVQCMICLLHVHVSNMDSAVHATPKCNCAQQDVVMICDVHIVSTHTA